MSDDTIKTEEDVLSELKKQGYVWDETSWDHSDKPVDNVRRWKDGWYWWYVDHRTITVEPRWGSHSETFNALQKQYD